MNTHRLPQVRRMERSSRGCWSEMMDRYHNAVSCPGCGYVEAVYADRDAFILNCKGCHKQFDVELVPEKRYIEPEHV